MRTIAAPATLAPAAGLATLAGAVVFADHAHADVGSAPKAAGPQFLDAENELASVRQVDVWAPLAVPRWL